MFLSTGQARKSSQKKGSKRSIQRMKFLESYCDKLLKCDQTVTRTTEVTQFFMPKDHDLLPDFTKNRSVLTPEFQIKWQESLNEFLIIKWLISLSHSIMILMSDCGGGEVSHQPRGSVTHPFVTQTYSCVAAYETKDTKNRPFKVAVDETLDVLIKDPAGQCLSFHVDGYWKSAKQTWAALSVFLSCLTVVLFPLQVGGWLRTTQRVWLGFLLPTCSYWTERMRKTLYSSMQVCVIFSQIIICRNDLIEQVHITSLFFIEKHWNVHTVK